MKKLFDVVIYELKTCKVDAIVGRNLNRNTGFYNAEKRAETAFSRINERFGVAIVKAGKYEKGDTLR